LHVILYTVKHFHPCLVASMVDRDSRDWTADFV